MMSYTKTYGLAIFLDFEKAFDSIEWKYLVVIGSHDHRIFENRDDLKNEMIGKKK